MEPSDGLRKIEIFEILRSPKDVVKSKFCGDAQHRSKMRGCAASLQNTWLIDRNIVYSMSSSFDSYQISYKTSSDSIYTNYDTSSALTPVITSLSPNTGYYIQLIPYSNTSGLYGSAIETYSVTLPKITSQSFSSSTYSSITLELTGSYDRNVIYYSVDNGSTYTYYDTSATSLMTVKGLTANQRYYFKITPLNIVNVSGTAVYITDASVVTSAYVNTFNMSQYTRNTITLSWTGIYSNAVIYYGLTSGSTTNNVPISTPSTNIGVTNSTDISALNHSTQYYFSIYPYNSISILGTISNTNASTDTNTYKIYYLIVGGGGGGQSGGGGAGAVVYMSAGIDISSSYTYTIIVGSGGIGGAEFGTTNGTNGRDSSITGPGLVSTSIVAKGGGLGGQNGGNGSDGGCCGGGGFSAGGTTTGGTSTQTSYTGHSVYSNIGGGNGIYNNNSSSPYPAGGGGGAGGVGLDPTSNTTAGNGGPGISIDITGTPTFYAGGGGGGVYLTNGTGGSGGSSIGASGVSGINNTNTASVNTGSGGGGGGGSSTGGNGASGVVILKIPTLYLGTYTGTNVNVSTSGSYTILKYTSTTGTNTYTSIGT